jgi:hypothetical protein
MCFTLLQMQRRGLCIIRQAHTSFFTKFVNMTVLMIYVTFYAASYNTQGCLTSTYFYIHSINVAYLDVL